MRPQAQETAPARPEQPKMAHHVQVSNTLAHRRPKSPVVLRFYTLNEENLHLFQFDTFHPPSVESMSQLFTPPPPGMCVE
jgi:hypothetical protein